VAAERAQAPETVVAPRHATDDKPGVGATDREPAQIATASCAGWA
jgi:hypothetical protein